MAIGNYFPQSIEDVIFNPTPSNKGKLDFSVENLLLNSIQEGDNSLFANFYNKTYSEPIEKIFDTKYILNFSVGMVDIPNKDGFGKSLYYSKEDFFKTLIDLLLSDVDTFGLTNEEIENKKNELHKYLIDYKDSPTDLNLVFSNLFKEREKIFRELKDNEFGSQRYDALLKYYSKYEGKIDYKEFLDMQYEITCKTQTGLLKLSNFFDRKIDYKELCKCFDEDALALLFAKIIKDKVLEYKNDEEITVADYNYLILYKNALDNALRDNPEYNAHIVWGELEYTHKDFLQEMDEFLEKYPDNGSVMLYDIKSEALYDQNLATNMYELFANQENYKFVKSGVPVSLENRERIESLNDDDISNEYLEKEQNKAKEANKRIEIVKSLEFIGYPLKGSNGYYAFIFANNKVLLEKFWDNEELFIPAMGKCAYVMNIDGFIAMSKENILDSEEYLKSITYEDLQRVFLDDLKGYERVIRKIIKGEGYYDNDYAFEYLNSLGKEDKYAK